MTDTQTNTGDVEEVIIEQDHKRNPGWFLVTAYVVISAFCVYYFFQYREWKSDYELQQSQMQVTASPQP